MARAHVEFAKRHLALHRWMCEAMRLTDSSGSLLKVRERAFAPVSSIFADGQAAGAVVSGAPEQLGLASFAAVQGLIAMSPGGQFNGLVLETLIDLVIERIILGLWPRS